jgi:hypothetical protein
VTDFWSGHGGGSAEERLALTSFQNGKNTPEKNELHILAVLHVSREWPEEFE